MGRPSDCNCHCEQEPSSLSESSSSISSISESVPSAPSGESSSESTISLSTIDGGCYSGCEVLPAFYQVTLSTSNGSCANCARVNGTYTLEFVGNFQVSDPLCGISAPGVTHCVWHGEQADSDPCFFDPTGRPVQVEFYLSTQRAYLHVFASGRTLFEWRVCSPSWNCLGSNTLTNCGSGGSCVCPGDVTLIPV